MKFKLNRAFREASGELDGLVYRNVRGKVIAARKPYLSNVVASEDQIAHRARFKQAAVYGKSVMANAEVRALYDAVAKSKDIPIFALTIADYFNAPTIHKVDLSTDDGTVGSSITVHATDDFEVVREPVTIQDAQATAIESGNAILDSGFWHYTAKVNAPAGAELVVKVVATDRPGGTAIETIPL